MNKTGEQALFLKKEALVPIKREERVDMKKIAAIIACLAVCLSLAACSGNDAESSSTVTENSSATPVSSQTDPESTTAATGSGTIEAYIASIQDTIDQMSESMKAQGMNIKVLARDKSLVYSYQLTTESADISQMKETLESGLESQASTFTQVLSGVKMMAPDTKSVIVEYLDKKWRCNRLKRIQISGQDTKISGGY